jgi:periplasmic protein TonB
MFRTLESTWDHSARRGWTTLASFAVQAFGMSLLLLIPLLTIQGPAKLQWFCRLPVPAPPPTPAPLTSGQQPIHSSNISQGQLWQPPTIPNSIANLNEQPVASSPDIGSLGVEGGTGMSRHGVWGSVGPSVDVVPPPPSPPAPTHPLKVSHWAEGNLVHRVQPIYPPLARQARIQGTVELRAIVSKAGTIENLTAVSGHPMLVASAMEAVRQWRYRPYLLNGDPIEVETDVTVNFVLSDG